MTRAKHAAVLVFAMAATYSLHVHADAISNTYNFGTRQSTGVVDMTTDQSVRFDCMPEYELQKRNNDNRCVAKAGTKNTFSNHGATQSACANRIENRLGSNDDDKRASHCHSKQDTDPQWLNKGDCEYKSGTKIATVGSSKTCSQGFVPIQFRKIEQIFTFPVRTKDQHQVYPLVLNKDKNTGGHGTCSDVDTVTCAKHDDASSMQLLYLRKQAGKFDGDTRTELKFEGDSSSVGTTSNIAISAQSAFTTSSAGYGANVIPHSQCPYSRGSGTNPEQACDSYQGTKYQNTNITADWSKTPVNYMGLGGSYICFKYESLTMSKQYIKTAPFSYTWDSGLNKVRVHCGEGSDIVEATAANKWQFTFATKLKHLLKCASAGASSDAYADVSVPAFTAMWRTEWIGSAAQNKLKKVMDQPMFLVQGSSRSSDANWVKDWHELFVEQTCAPVNNMNQNEQTIPFVVEYFTYEQGSAQADTLQRQTAFVDMTVESDQSIDQLVTTTVNIGGTTLAQREDVETTLIKFQPTSQNTAAYHISMYYTSLGSIGMATYPLMISRLVYGPTDTDFDTSTVTNVGMAMLRRTVIMKGGSIMWTKTMTDVEVVPVDDTQNDCPSSEYIVYSVTPDKPAAVASILYQQGSSVELLAGTPPVVEIEVEIVITLHVFHKKAMCADRSFRMLGTHVNADGKFVARSQEHTHTVPALHTTVNQLYEYINELTYQGLYSSSRTGSKMVHLELNLYFDNNNNKKIEMQGTNALISKAMFNEVCYPTSTWPDLSQTFPVAYTENKKAKDYVWQCDYLAEKVSAHHCAHQALTVSLSKDEQQKTSNAVILQPTIEVQPIFIVTCLNSKGDSRSGGSETSTGEGSIAQTAPTTTVAQMCPICSGTAAQTNTPCYNKVWVWYARDVPLNQALTPVQMGYAASDASKVTDARSKLLHLGHDGTADTAKDGTNGKDAFDTLMDQKLCNSESTTEPKAYLAHLKSIQDHSSYSKIGSLTHEEELADAFLSQLASDGTTYNNAAVFFVKIPNAHIGDFATKAHVQVTADVKLNDGTGTTRRSTRSLLTTQTASSNVAADATSQIAPPQGFHIVGDYASCPSDITVSSNDNTVTHTCNVGSSSDDEDSTKATVTIVLVSVAVFMLLVVGGMMVFSHQGIQAIRKLLTIPSRMQVETRGSSSSDGIPLAEVKVDASASGKNPRMFGFL